MLRASTILSHARLDRDLTIEEASKKLKIPVKHLQAIEQENKADFPHEPYCSLIIKDYANFLNLNGDEVLRIFHRDFDRQISPPKSATLNLGLTPGLFFRLSLLLLFVFFAGYLLREYLSFTRPPKLVVNWPETILVDSNLNLTGQTDSEATVIVNGDSILTDPEGKFSTTIKLPPGGLNVTIESRSIAGKTTTVSRHLEPSQ